MEFLALFRNSFLFILSFSFTGCYTNAPENLNTDCSALDREKQEIRIEKGLLIIHQKPYTGKLFSLFNASTDTAEVSSYLNGREHGEWKKYHPSGKIKERRFFENGKKTGAYDAWWANGKKQLHYFFVAGEYEGTCKEWNAEGKLLKIMNYKRGYEDGLQQWWYDDGKIKANYFLKNGRRYGLLGTKNCTNVSDSVFRI